MTDPLMNLIVCNVKRLPFSWSPLNDPTSCGAFTGVTVNFSHENFKKLVYY